MDQQVLHLSEDESGLGSPLPLRLSRIDRFKGQPRKKFSKKALETLADSLQEEGQKTPVKVCRHPTQPGQFILIGGERRWRAFHLIQERTGKEPIVLAFIDAVHGPSHHFKEALIDNLQREDLVELDEAAAYHRLHTEDGMSKEQIAKFVKKSWQHVDNYIKVHSLPQEVKDLMDYDHSEERGRLTITSAISIARSVVSPELQIAVAMEAIDRGLDTKDTRALIGIRTGQTGYGVGGRMRKPSDDYKIFRSFLGRTDKATQRFDRQLDLDTLYRSRDNEKEERVQDGQVLRSVISRLEKMLKQVEGD